ncbi:MAG: flagellar hook assembly protein FlgD [Planctomycetota bacterium]|jgi:flagellar basal-body rod modification protein FlgD
MSEIASASSMQVDYIQLLTTQLKNQNPLEPMDNNDMTAQLAQFSELNQLESMNSSFAEVLKRTEQNYGSSLLGKEVSFIGQTSTGDVDLITGNVDQVVHKDGDVLLGVGDYSLTLQDIIGIKEKASE